MMLFPGEGEVPGFSSEGIFLSYRREDTAPYARLLQRDLSQRFPDARVFMDLDSIEPGVDFVEVIQEAVDSAAVLVVLIGRQWTTLIDEDGARRLDDPGDYVRFEVKIALERGVRVIPVLIDGAKPLRQQELPAELHKLARLNAHKLSYDRYQDDADRLLDIIQRVLATADEPTDTRHQASPQVSHQVTGEAKRLAPEDAQRKARDEAALPGLEQGGRSTVASGAAAKPREQWRSSRVRGTKRRVRPHWFSAFRYPTWKKAAVALMLLLLPWAVALVQVLRHGHLDSGAVGIVATISLGLPALWLAWAGYRESRYSDEVSGLTMAHLADQLAVAVRIQWEVEAAMRRLNDPYPLPVSWTAADPSLTDPWDLLVRLAANGAGWPARPPTGIWAAGPDELAGSGSDLVDVLARVPTGRLAVLGDPGAGKTMLMVRLVLDLLARRTAGGIVPILFSVASWNPADQDLRDWMGAQLSTDHPALAAAPAGGLDHSTPAAALIDSGLILPVLDGLDEIPEKVRGMAISRINDALRPGECLVLTARSQEYRDAVRPQGGAEVTLRAAAAVQVHPLGADAVRSYLCDDAAGPVAKARWDPVLAVLGTDAPAGQALSTPLMVALAREVYNPRASEVAGKLRDPAELCNPALADPAAVESLLFDAFIPAAYRNDAVGRWKGPNAERWLVFLARHLERNIGGPDLAWWQLPLAIPAFRAFKARGGIIRVGVPGVVTLDFVWEGFPSDASAAASPPTALARDRKRAILSGTVVAITSGVVFGALFGIPAGVMEGVAAGVIDGVVAAALSGAAGAIFGVFIAEWPWYEIARIWLTLRRQLPWPFMGFLADAHRRGILRQAGAVYQFRHRATAPPRHPAASLNRRLLTPLLNLSSRSWFTGR